MKYAEQKLQTAIVVGLRRTFDCLVWHCPNGGARTRLEALAFKDAGVTAGVADLTVTGPDRLILFIEIKDEVQVRERSVSPFERIHSLDPAQKVFAERERGFGHRVAVVDSVEDAVTACEAVGFPPKPAAPPRSAAALSTGF